jgi:hypothetical protein
MTCLFLNSSDGIANPQIHYELEPVSNVTNSFQTRTHHPLSSYTLLYTKAFSKNNQFISCPQTTDQQQGSSPEVMMRLQWIKPNGLGGLCESCEGFTEKCKSNYTEFPSHHSHNAIMKKTGNNKCW